MFTAVEKTNIESILAVMNTAELVAAPVSQGSWIQISYGPEFFSGLISTTSSVMLITARIDSIFVA